MNTFKLDVQSSSINKVTSVWEVDSNGNPMDGMGYEGVIRFDFTHLPGLSFVWEPESGMGYFYSQQQRVSEPQFMEIRRELWEDTKYCYEIRDNNIKFSGEALVRDDVDLSDTCYQSIDFGVEFPENYLE